MFEDRKVVVGVAHSSNHHHLQELVEVPGWCQVQCLPHSHQTGAGGIGSGAYSRTPVSEVGHQDHLEIDLVQVASEVNSFRLLMHVRLLEDLYGLQLAPPSLHNAIAHRSP